MDKTTITPPPGAMAQFRAQLRLAHDAEQRRTTRQNESAAFDAAGAFRCVGVKVIDRAWARGQREVLDDIADILGAPGALEGSMGYAALAAQLFGEDLAAETVACLRPLSRRGFRVQGIDTFDPREEPSYDKAMALMRGNVPTAAEVAAALGDASPDGPRGHVWKTLDSRWRTRRGDWSGVSDRDATGSDVLGYYQALSKGFIVKEVILSDEVDVDARVDPLKEADAIAKATAGPARQVHGRDALDGATDAGGWPQRFVSRRELAKILNRSETAVVKWRSEGCPFCSTAKLGSSEPPREEYVVGDVVRWLEERAAKRVEVGLQPIVIEIGGAKVSAKFSTRGIDEIRAAFAKATA